MGRSKSGEGLARVNDLRDAALKLIKAFGQWEAVTVTTGELYFQTTNVGLLRLSCRTQSRRQESEQADKWSFCLTAKTLMRQMGIEALSSTRLFKSCLGPVSD
jgi:hypothetical protein